MTYPPADERYYISERAQPRLKPIGYNARGTPYMPLDPGAHLGPYEVLAPLGAGGMGEVYRARDPRLGRDVAIKVLPSGLSADAERLRRFEQEARAAAALNHPNILAVHDIGQHDGAPYIVSELLEGDTLRERLTGAALPVRKAVEYAVQIAHGLAAAHEKGITHRDLKPDNVFVTGDGRVKILDFGLAKLTQAEPALSGMSALPTTPPDTMPGVVLGTIGYMSPEQVRGQQADHRSDVFAFGVILYEMLSGQRAFHRDTAIETMSAILKEDPPDLPVAERHIPPALARVVDHCLEKNPAARFKSADDLAFALEALSAQSERSEVSAAVAAVPTRGSRERWRWMLAGAVSGAAVAALVAVTIGYFTPTPSDTGAAYRASILPPAGVSLPAGIVPPGRFALSPDGRRLAFIGVEGGGATRLWVQTLDGVSPEPLAGTEGAQVPFWSPDSRFIGFRAGGKLKRIDASGGPPLTLADTAGSPGATWNADDLILFGTFGPGNPIRRVAASGGPVTAVTTLDADAGEIYHGYPFFLPDGRHFLYIVVGSTSGGASPNGLYVAALDSNERKLLVPGLSNAMYSNSHLLFLKEQTLMAQPFDLERLELTGEPLAIAQQVATGGVSESGGFSVSQTGVLAYQTGPADVGGQAIPLVQLTWFDRSGKQLGALGDQARSADVEVAPDGRRAAMSIFDLARRTSDIWLFDIARGLQTRFTFDPADDGNPIWSPDASRVVFAGRRKGHFDLYMKQSSGAGGEEELLADSLDKFPLDWSSDGRSVLYAVNDPKTGLDLWVLPLAGDRKPVPFLQTSFSEYPGQFSPDGRWIAYVSNESGRNEVYVAPFAGPGGKWQVSTAGGTWPRWRPDGSEISYRALDNRLMAVEVDGQKAAFQVGTVRPLFSTRPGGPRYIYDVTPDGQRFLMNTLVEEAASAPITLVVNWRALLRK